MPISIFFHRPKGCDSFEKSLGEQLEKTSRESGPIKHNTASAAVKSKIEIENYLKTKIGYKVYLSMNFWVAIDAGGRQIKEMGVSSNSLIIRDIYDIYKVIESIMIQYGEFRAKNYRYPFQLESLTVSVAKVNSLTAEPVAVKSNNSFPLVSKIEVPILGAVKVLFVKVCVPVRVTSFASPIVAS